jgi:hypothetical protein
MARMLPHDWRDSSPLLARDEERLYEANVLCGVSVCVCE